MGWFELVAIEQVGPFVAFGWFANPCLWLAWICVFTANRLLAVLFALIGLLIGLAFLLGKTVLSSESGSDYPITGYGAGYRLWIASLALALGAGVLSLILKGRRTEEDELSD